jgi:hypothetical protein
MVVLLASQFDGRVQHNNTNYTTARGIFRARSVNPAIEPLTIAVGPNVMAAGANFESTDA